MELLVTILLGVLIAVGGLLALLLVMPLSVAIEGAVDETQAALVARARWALGLIGVEYRFGHGAWLRILGFRVARLRGDSDGKRRKRRRKKVKQASKKPKPKRGPGWAWRHRDTLWTAALRLLGLAHLRGRLTGVVGLPEPDQTAWVDVALRQLERVVPRRVVDVEVDYMDDVIDLTGRLSAWVVPGQVLVVGLAIYFDRDVRRALRAQ